MTPTEVVQDPILQAHVSAMRAASKSADYYLLQFRQFQKHCEYAHHAQKLYRGADTYLQKLGVCSNTARQELIHAVVENTGLVAPTVIEGSVA